MSTAVQFKAYERVAGMKVSELIAKLSELPADAEALMVWYGTHPAEPVLSVVNRDGSVYLSAIEETATGD